MIGLIAGAASLAGSIVSGISAANSSRAKSKILNQREEEIQQWYNQESNTDILDTSAVKSALSSQRKQHKEQQRKLSDSVVSRGLSDEAKVAYAAELNDDYANTISNVAAQGDRRDREIESSYRNEKNRLDNMRYEIQSAKSSAMSGLVDNIGQVAGSVIGNEALLGNGFGIKNRR